MFDGLREHETGERAAIATMVKKMDQS